MAAYVGLGVPPALAIILGWAGRFLPGGPFIAGGMLFSLVLLARMGFILFGLILPRRAGMAPPANEWEATLFGTIAGSRWQSLVWLCLGCAIMMIAPLYVIVGAAAINLAFAGPSAEAILAGNAPVEWGQRWYAVQAVAAWGTTLAVWALLTAGYLAYLALGKIFHRLRG